MIEPRGTVFVDTAWLAGFEHRVRGLAFRPRGRGRSVLAGQHGSRMRGRGLSFDEIRAYLPGDDVRTIDWKATLRVGKPMLRSYTEERDRPLLLVVDQRASMFFGTRRAMKSVVAAELAALGAWMALRAGDRIGAVVFGDERSMRVRPHRSRARVLAVLGAIAEANRALDATHVVAGSDARLDEALADALALAPHDALVLVISDFAGAGEPTRDRLRALAAHNDVIAALVFDPSAREPAAKGGRIVVSGGELQVELDLGDRRVRERSEALFAGRLRDVAELLRASGVPQLEIDTEQETLGQLARLLGNAR